MARSATAVMVSVSVALLLAGVGSVTPAGAAMVAVLLMVPLAPPATVALTVKVAVPPLSRLTAAAMLPLPLAGQLEPAEAAQVQAPKVRFAGAVSVTVAAVTALGPLLVATMVETVLPRASVPGTPSVLVMAWTATAVMVSASVALLVAGAGSVWPDGAASVTVL